jgi:hypothetical protein
VTPLNESIARRIGKLVRMFSSSFENEQHVALKKLGSLLVEEGLTFSDIATVIENCNGEIEQLKYSDADAAAIYQRGVDKGRAEPRAQEPTEFFDENGMPHWYEIAVFCRDSQGRPLTDWERSFVEDMPTKIAGWGQPTSAQRRHLLRVFIKLGGFVDARVVRNFM